MTKPTKAQGTPVDPLYPQHLSQLCFGTQMVLLQAAHPNGFPELYYLRPCRYHLPIRPSNLIVCGAGGRREVTEVEPESTHMATVGHGYLCLAT